jgi:hypothetical protein
MIIARGKVQPFSGKKLLSAQSGIGPKMKKKKDMTNI